MQHPPFAVGAVLHTRRRTLTEGDMAMLINATWENAPLHTDAVLMAQSKFKRPVLGGPCIIPVLAGLSTPAIYASWEAADLEPVAALGLDEVRYENPLFAGDTVCLEMVVSRCDPTPGGSRIIGEFTDRLYNQDDVTILRMRRSYMLRSTR